MHDFTAPRVQDGPPEAASRFRSAARWRHAGCLRASRRVPPSTCAAGWSRRSAAMTTIGWARLTCIFLVGLNVVSNVPFILVVRDQMGSLSDPALAWELLAMASTFAGNVMLLGSGALLAHRAQGEPRCQNQTQASGSSPSLKCRVGGRVRAGWEQRLRAVCAGRTRRCVWGNVALGQGGGWLERASVGIEQGGCLRVLAAVAGRRSGRGRCAFRAWSWRSGRALAPFAAGVCGFR